ncbi:MAG: hypothetical protein QM754_12075 [Tepidisphaeraceae bacterium]
MSANLLKEMEIEGKLHSSEAMDHVLLRSREGRPNPAKWHRLTKLGKRGTDGKLHKLDAVRLTDGWYTTVSEIHRFVNKLNGRSAASDVPVPPSKTKTAAAMKELAEAGLN